MNDVTEHPTAEGRVYLAGVLDAWSRRVVGWSIADHPACRTGLRRAPHGHLAAAPTQGPERSHIPITAASTSSWAFGQRLRNTRLLGSIGSIGDAYDNALAESFFATLQRQLLDRHPWRTRRELALAIFEWIEAWYNPHRRHSSIRDLAPIEHEQAALGDC